MVVHSKDNHVTTNPLFTIRSNGMDSWPADCKKRGGDTAKQRERNANRRTDGFPHLVPGALGAMSLYERGNRLEWTSLLKKSPGGQNFTVDIFLFDSNHCV
jgi:hypothetical protein